MKLAEDVVAAIEASERLDGPAYKVTNAISSTLELAPVSGRRVQDALHGTWLGHPLHPAAATLPIGAWTLAFGLDTAAGLGFGNDRGVARAADIALGVGAAGAVLAAASGMMDWRKVHGRDRRTGLVHAAVNSTALGLTLGSLALRRRGRRRQARALSAAGWLAMMGGAWLGGHMVYRRGLGTDHADRSREPRDFVPVIAVDALDEDRPRRIAVHDPAAGAGVGIVIVRHRGRVHAMGARCSHMGGPLDEGWVQDGGLVCPWHGSRYCLVSGAVMNGPSTAPQPRYQVRVQDGMVELRREQEPGDEVVTRGDMKQAAAAPMPAVPAGARKADEVLYEHHELLRRLFERIAAMSPDDPERRDLMRVLAGELEIHEHVEDAIFYPAVRAVSEDVQVAHAEHQQLADMLALTLRVGTSSPRFDAHLQALHQAVDHHAKSEETSMFVEAQRLGDAHLRVLGAQIEDMLDDERQNRARRAFRSLKTRLLEGI
ncbi:MAG: Rieske 2Fe-2S domain-containing protein [Rhodobacterales bacterium]|nr:Rieske 2Fe-2S domain-containing protein [Rhodobacterales bacterium]MDX5412497.1 Rieske 2Fe-2S domain-containing protein [Rhodobacterales bacterium]